MEAHPANTRWHYARGPLTGFAATLLDNGWRWLAQGRVVSRQGVTYDLDFEEGPLDLDLFDEDLDDEDLDSDMELYRRWDRTNRFGGRFNGPRSRRRFDGNLKNRALRQLESRGRISSRLASRLNRRQVRRVFQAEGLRPSQARLTRSGAIVVGRRRNNRRFHRYLD